MAKKKVRMSAVSGELKKIYKDAWEDGIWVREFTTQRRGSYLSAAGTKKKILELEKAMGMDIKISKLSLGDCVNLGVPGSGRTRESACRNAIKKVKKLVRYFQSHS